MEPRAHEKMRCQCASPALPVWNWAQLSILPGGKPKEQFLHVSAFNGLSVSERKNPNQDCQKIKQLLHNEFSLSDGGSKLHLLQLQFQLFFLLAGVAPPRDMRKPHQLPGPSRESHMESLLSPSHLPGHAGAGSCHKQSHRLC